MSLIIVLGCLLGAFVLGIISAKVLNVLNSGKAVAVGVIAGVVLAVLALVFIGAAAAVSALVGAVAGSVAYFLLTALTVGGC